MKLLILLFLIISPIFAGDHKHDKHHLPLDVTYLELDKHQYKKLVKIVKKFKHDRKKIHKEEKQRRKEISKLFLSETFDRDKFIEQINKLKEQSVQRQADFFLEMHKLLTPKQKRHFVKYMKEWELE